MYLRYWWGPAIRILLVSNNLRYAKTDIHTHQPPLLPEDTGCVLPGRAAMQPQGWRQPRNPVSLNSQVNNCGSTWTQKRPHPLKGSGINHWHYSPQSKNNLQRPWPLTAKLVSRKWGWVAVLDPRRRGWDTTMSRKAPCARPLQWMDPF